MKYPFTETKHEDYYIREFSQDTNEEEFIWHRDREDRIVESLHSTDWKVQLDNELPTNLDRPIFIRRELFHRLIKGTENLKIKLIKIPL